MSWNCVPETPLYSETDYTHPGRHTDTTALTPVAQQYRRWGRIPRRSIHCDLAVWWRLHHVSAGIGTVLRSIWYSPVGAALPRTPRFSPIVDILPVHTVMDRRCCDTVLVGILNYYLPKSHCLCYLIRYSWRIGRHLPFGFVSATQP